VKIRSMGSGSQLEELLATYTRRGSASFQNCRSDEHPHLSPSANLNISRHPSISPSPSQSPIVYIKSPSLSPNLNPDVGINLNMREGLQGALDRSIDSHFATFGTNNSNTAPSLESDSSGRRERNGERDGIGKGERVIEGERGKKREGSSDADSSRSQTEDRTAPRYHSPKLSL
jgi:hypothetical protein